MVDNLNSEISENLHNLVRLYEGATYFKNAEILSVITLYL